MVRRPLDATMSLAHLDQELVRAVTAMFVAALQIRLQLIDGIADPDIGDPVADDRVGREEVVLDELAERVGEEIAVRVHPAMIPRARKERKAA